MLNQFGVGEWIAIGGAISGFLGSFALIWLRLGKILAKFEHVAETTGRHDTQLADHEKRLIAVEAWVEG